MRSPTPSTEWSPGQVNTQVQEKQWKQCQAEEYEQRARAEVELELELERRELWEQEQEKRRQYWQERRGNEWWWDFEQHKECEEEDKRRQCWEQEQGCERTQERRGREQMLEVELELEQEKVPEWECGHKEREQERKHERDQLECEIKRLRKRVWELEQRSEEARQIVLAMESQQRCPGTEKYDLELEEPEWEYDLDRKREHIKRSEERMNEWIALRRNCRLKGEWEWKWLEQAREWEREQAREREREWETHAQALRRHFSRILRLSTWNPSLANNRKVAGLILTANEQLNQLRDDEEYRVYLGQFMEKHHALCAFILSRINDITSDESIHLAELCKDLRRLAQKLRSNAVKKAEGYERLYDEFVVNREGLSNWLNSASADLGRSLVDSFTSNLKHMATSMRSEANFWEFAAGYDWQDIRHKYTSAIDAMPSFPSDQANTSITLPFEVPPESNPENLGQVAQRVSTSFNDLKTAVVATQPKVIQKFLAKTGQSITKRFDETEGYLKLAKDTVERQLSPRLREGLSKSPVMTIALQVAKSWNNLYLRVKYGASILSFFSKPMHALMVFAPDEPQFQLSSSDYYARVVATLGIAAKECHPCLIDCEAFLWSMSEHFWSLVRICDDRMSTISSSSILGSSFD